MTITLDGGTVEVVTPTPTLVTAVVPPSQLVDVHNVPRVIVAEGGAAGGHVLPQTTPTAQWSFPNPTARLADVTIYTPDGEQIEADVWVTPTLITVTFPQPTTGAIVVT